MWISQNVEVPSRKRDPLRIVMLGKTGQGKSATANKLLGENKFKDDCSSKSVTKESLRQSSKKDGRKISIMDTPGLQDTNRSNDDILKEIGRITKFFPDGVHGFIYVMNAANPRFTTEDRESLELIEEVMGKGFIDFCLLVLTHAESLPERSLDKFLKAQKKGRDDNDSLSLFLKDISWKVVAVDNSSTVPYECETSRNRIIAIIDKMRESNAQKVYTTAMFEHAQREREALRLKGLKKGWDESLMEIVEEVIASNPKITRKTLQKAVDEEIKERTSRQAQLLKEKKKEHNKVKLQIEKLEKQLRMDENSNNSTKKKMAINPRTERNADKKATKLVTSTTQRLENVHKKRELESRGTATRPKEQEKSGNDSTRSYDGKRKPFQPKQFRLEEKSQREDERRIKEEEMLRLRKDEVQNVQKEKLEKENLIASLREKELQEQKEMTRLGEENERLERALHDDSIRDQVNEIGDEHSNWLETVYRGVLEHAAGLGSTLAGKAAVMAGSWIKSWFF